MKIRSFLVAGSLAVALAALTSGVSAKQPAGPESASGQRAVSAAPLASKQRGELVRQFVMKWGPYVQDTYEVPVGVWAQRMVPGFVVADATNFRNALRRNTFEGAMAELSGVGRRLSDTQAIDRLARVSLASTAKAGDIGIQSLGALNNDLVYTPVQPCRIIDTRNTGAGAIAAGSTRSFLAFGVSNYTAQGGSATSCGLNPLAATAVAINLTAVFPANAGYATAYPYGTTQPLAASVNYAAGAIVNNALIVQTPNPVDSFDITIYTYAQSHYVADIVGYFAPPVATALECVETAPTVVNLVAGGTGNATAPTCEVGYTQTSTNCEAENWLVPFVIVRNGTCSARNNGGTAENIIATRTCCRVPGR